MRGPDACDTAMALPDGLNATPSPLEVGSVAGLENLVPKPEPLHGYAETKGVEPYATAMASPAGEKATPSPVPAGNVAGLENLVPKPEPLHGYAETKGDVE